MKQKKVVLRKCVITNEVLPKNSLIRIVVTKDKKVVIDKEGKVNGHGIYVKPLPEAISLLIKKKLIDKISKIKIDKEFYQQLLIVCQNY